MRGVEGRTGGVGEDVQMDRRWLGGARRRAGRPRASGDDGASEHFVRGESRMRQSRGEDWVQGGVVWCDARMEDGDWERWVGRELCPRDGEGQ